MRFFFGKRVECIGNVPNGMEALEIPAAKYAVFTGFITDILQAPMKESALKKCVMNVVVKWHNEIL